MLQRRMINYVPVGVSKYTVARCQNVCFTTNWSEVPSKQLVIFNEAVSCCYTLPVIAETTAVWRKNRPIFLKP